MLGAQDSLLSRITPRFLVVDEGDTMTSLTVTDRSMQGQSIPRMKSSVLSRLSLKCCAAVKQRCLPDILRCKVGAGGGWGKEINGC